MAKAKDKKQGKKDTKKKKRDLVAWNLALRLGLLTVLIAIVLVLVLIFDESLPPIMEPEEFMVTRSHSTVFYEFDINTFQSKVIVTAQDPSDEKIKVGIVGDTSNLNFGEIPEGGSAIRHANMANIGNAKAKVIMRAYGSIGPFVNFDKNEFVLAPGEETTVTITFSAKKGDAGEYEGGIDRIVKVPKYGFLNMFW